MLDGAAGTLVVTDWHEFAALDDEFVVDTISRIFIAPLALPKLMSAVSVRKIPLTLKWSVTVRNRPRCADK